MTNTQSSGTQMVRIFSTPNCQQCRMTYLALDRAGVDYTVIDVSVDEAAAEYVKNLGYLQAPVVVLNEQTHWNGFRPDLIAAVGGVRS